MKQNQRYFIQAHLHYKGVTWDLTLLESINIVIFWSEGESWQALKLGWNLHNQFFARKQRREQLTTISAASCGDRNPWGFNIGSSSGSLAEGRVKPSWKRCNTFFPLVGLVFFACTAIVSLGQRLTCLHLCIYSSILCNTCQPWVWSCNTNLGLSFWIVCGLNDWLFLFLVNMIWHIR